MERLTKELNQVTLLWIILSIAHFTCRFWSTNRKCEWNVAQTARELMYKRHNADLLFWQWSQEQDSLSDFIVDWTLLILLKSSYWPGPALRTRNAKCYCSSLPLTEICVCRSRQTAVIRGRVKSSMDCVQLGLTNIKRYYLLHSCFSLFFF